MSSTRQSDSGSKPGAASDQPCAGVVTGPVTWRPRALAFQPQKSYLQACGHTREWLSRPLPPPRVPRAGGASAAGACAEAGVDHEAGETCVLGPRREERQTDEQMSE